MIIQRNDGTFVEVGELATQTEIEGFRRATSDVMRKWGYYLDGRSWKLARVLPARLTFVQDATCVGGQYTEVRDEDGKVLIGYVGCGTHLLKVDPRLIAMLGAEVVRE